MINLQNICNWCIVFPLSSLTSLSTLSCLSGFQPRRISYRVSSKL